MAATERTPKPSRYVTADLVLDTPVPGCDQFFTYELPDETGFSVCPGQRVLVPFGQGNRPHVAMVMQVHAPGAVLYRQNLKPIGARIDEQPVLNDEQLRMAEWLHDQTMCSWTDAVRALLPGGMQYRPVTTFRLKEHASFDGLPPRERELAEQIRDAVSQKARLALMDCTAHPGREQLLRSLAAHGVMVEENTFKRTVGDKSTLMVRLSDAYIEDRSIFRITEAQQPVLQVMIEHDTLSVKECSYLSGKSELVIKNMAKKGVLQLFETEALRIPRDAVVTISPADTVLSPQQTAAFQTIAQGVTMDKAAAYLLYGVTGSGKTAVFEQLIALTLSLGRQVLMLIPEISLTPQAVQYFQSRFGNQVVLIHSGLSLAQRMDTDKLIRRGEVSIVIGTRSAIFAPLNNIGLIVVDEEGERSYKSESAPRYHAIEAAKWRARQHKSALVLASATPSLESRFLAERGVYQLVEMRERYNNAPLPHVQIVDMTEERMNGNLSTFSVPLSEALRENLERGEQSILLLNRRGYHTMLQCTHCSQPLFCPQCSVPMTYHKVNGRLLCHYCGHMQTVPRTCPECGSEGFRSLGFGTQKLEEELRQLLPDARVLRMDADTTMRRSAYEESFQRFSRGEYDILCGTQMISKGLDFPNVTLVGVVSIDKALYAGDFRSYERTFSLVTQVVGRGGRGRRQGRAILQTFMPDHYVIQLAAAQNYDRFYTEEIALRRTMTYPPVCDICVIGFVGLNETTVRQCSELFRQRFEAALRGAALNVPMQLLGPADASYARISGKFRRRMLIKCKNVKPVRDLIRGQLLEAANAREFRGVTVYADMNGDCDL